MRIKQIIIHNNLSKMKSRILPNCLQGNYRDSLGEFSNTSYGVFEAERVKVETHLRIEELNSYIYWIGFFIRGIF